MVEEVLTCQDIVREYLKNIQEQDHLNVFLEVYAEEALQRAGEIDLKIKNGTAGRLAGMVIGLKDILCYQDHKLQASSKILEGFHSQFTGTAIQRLLDEDAIIIGRQNCDEFAMGSSNENSAYGVTRNAADHAAVPGGSSGASAVSVQANLCTAALGSDTGGSVRQPAAFCGVVGLKPTYSRISRYGLLAYASSFDTIGIFTNNIEDNALLLEIIAGKDDYDSTVYQGEVPAYTQRLAFDKKVKVAYIEETLNNEGLNEEVRERTEKAIKFLQNDGHQVEVVHFSMLDYLLPTYYILTMAEASSNLSRFDGIKYGHRNKEARNLEAMYKKSRSEAFGEEVKRRIMLGTFVLSASYYDAYYTKAQKVRRLIQEATLKILEDYDFIVLPTTPTTAFKIGDTNTPLEMYLADLFTVQASIAGVPAVSIPNGEDQAGLPIGLQIMTGNFQEDKLFAFSKYILDNLA
ncbi:aspartyl-tRNA(Asn)/glutamyl-tRNA(Gln) amidotransferase subunit A [Catalinimonas alkaloidigena]|uniref:Asp-tRNA(Asn)/Glu-tRNA(Gln) amidotransferase subunit GatA n=1 Tax=Catalinimonas alkaloidigena TaxID=1075417 RepID=UPI0024061ECA|nr:Asp-tRNA(Asn)/Glu-tRNA(Gln) amidotransferase subunit GatA [Catalinimonas alkaloidigena]MDF9795147.1 aspartyl-tRNA(Asn)/glutamyl-tRNA(Gln) amidotransferase subunit A [Catalinimonas alkaloidigena]